jgi:hypothetical protein
MQITEPAMLCNPEGRTQTQNEIDISGFQEGKNVDCGLLSMTTLGLISMIPI